MLSAVSVRVARRGLHQRNVCAAALWAGPLRVGGIHSDLCREPTRAFQRSEKDFDFADKTCYEYYKNLGAWSFKLYQIILQITCAVKWY